MSNCYLVCVFSLRSVCVITRRCLIFPSAVGSRDRAAPLSVTLHFATRVASTSCFFFHTNTLLHDPDGLSRFLTAQLQLFS